jgi:hypothetical protein
MTIIFSAKGERLALSDDTKPFFIVVQPTIKLIAAAKMVVLIIIFIFAGPAEYIRCRNIICPPTSQ